MAKKYGWVCSGGGSKGSWAGGVSQFLCEKRNYSYFSASSTGSLLMGLVALKEFDKLKTAYTSVTNDDIYKISPYKIKSMNNGVIKTKMNILNIFYNIVIRKKKTFGDSTNLRKKLLPKFFTEEDFDNIKNSNKELLIALTNLTLGTSEIKSSHDCNYTDYLDWVFGSTCAVPFMSIMRKNNYEYCDGGYTRFMPIQTLIDKGCTEIDVINLKQNTPSIEIIRNPFHLINRLIDVVHTEQINATLELTQLKAKKKDVIINIYSPDDVLTNNSLIFNKKIMTKWWEDGYEFAKEKNFEKWKISKEGDIEQIN